MNQATCIKHHTALNFLGCMFCLHFKKVIKQQLLFTLNVPTLFTYIAHYFCTSIYLKKLGEGNRGLPFNYYTYLFTYITHSDDTTTLAPDDTTTEMDTEAPTTIFETTTISTTTTTTTTTTESTKSCHAKGIWSRTPGMDHWCTLNCNHIPPFCPATHCTCD